MTTLTSYVYDGIYIMAEADSYMLRSKQHGFVELTFPKRLTIYEQCACIKNLLDGQAVRDFLWQNYPTEVMWIEDDCCGRSAPYLAASPAYCLVCLHEANFNIMEPQDAF